MTVTTRNNRNNNINFRWPLLHYSTNCGCPWPSILVSCSSYVLVLLSLWLAVLMSLAYCLCLLQIVFPRSGVLVSCSFHVLVLLVLCFPFWSPCILQYSCPSFSILCLKVVMSLSCCSCVLQLLCPSSAILVSYSSRVLLLLSLCLAVLVSFFWCPCVL